MLVKISDNSFYDTNFNGQTFDDDYSELRDGLCACWSGIALSMYDSSVDSITNQTIDGIVRVVVTIVDGPSWAGASTEMVDDMVEYTTHSDIGSHTRMMNVYNAELLPWYGPTNNIPDNVVYMS